jgi:hypothetical protein
MKYRYAFVIALGLYALNAASCRTEWKCQCMMVDSLGHPTSSASYDYGTISYSKAQDKCYAGNQVWDTCELGGYK